MTARAVSQNMKLCREMLHFSTVSSKASIPPPEARNKPRGLLAPARADTYSSATILKWLRTLLARNNCRVLFVSVHLEEQKKKSNGSGATFSSSGFGNLVQHVA